MNKLIRHGIAQVIMAFIAICSGFWFTVALRKEFVSMNVGWLASLAIWFICNMLFFTARREIFTPRSIMFGMVAGLMVTITATFIVSLAENKNLTSLTGAIGFASVISYVAFGLVSGILSEKNFIWWPEHE